IVKPETVIACTHRAFDWGGPGKTGAAWRRPTVAADIRTLTRTMAQGNPRWGAPRIHGELLKLGPNKRGSATVELGRVQRPAGGVRARAAEPALPLRPRGLDRSLRRDRKSDSLNS